MLLIPKRTKFRKNHKGRIRGEENRSITLSFGDFGLQALDSGRLRSNQIEAARKAIVRKLKRSGKLWIRVFPDIPVTSKPSEVRMGKGKGSVSHYIFRVRKHRIIFELSGVNIKLAKQALEYGSGKLPFKTKFIYRTSN